MNLKYWNYLFIIKREKEREIEVYLVEGGKILDLDLSWNWIFCCCVGLTCKQNLDENLCPIKFKIHLLNARGSRPCLYPIILNQNRPHTVLEGFYVKKMQLALAFYSNTLKCYVSANRSLT